jgi:hypothetical protein
MDSHAIAHACHAAATFVLQFPQSGSSQLSQDQANKIGAAMAGMMGIFAIVGFAFYAFFAFLFWRIFTKAGMAGALGLLLFIPGLGIIICLCILAFGEWKVIPAPQLVYYPPQYPPQYPPAPPTQL